MTAPAVVEAGPLLAAIKAAVTAGGAAGVAFDVGRKPATATTRWVVAWPNGGTIENRSLRSRDGWSLLVPFQCYGQTPEAADYAFRKVRAAALGLHGQTIGGRVVHVLTPGDPPPLSRDDDAEPPIFMQYDEVRFRLS